MFARPRNQYNAAPSRGRFVLVLCAAGVEPAEKPGSNRRRRRAKARRNSAEMTPEAANPAPQQIN